jgi:putative phage-type endonuclease
MIEPVIQRSPEWYAERAKGVSSTDIVSILGLSPYRSEGDVARAKQGTNEPPDTPEGDRRKRLGLAMEAIVAHEDEIEHGIQLRHVDELLYHPTIEWAVTSLDFTRASDSPCIVEIKTSRSAKWDDGLPLDVEAQVGWQMGVARYPRAHIAVMRYGSELECHDLEHDEMRFLKMVRVAADFRRRLELGGPFAETKASIKRAFPTDDGSTITPDRETIEAVHDLVATRAAQKTLSDRRDALETAIQTRIGFTTAKVEGPDFTIYWKRSKDSTVVAWGEVAHAMKAAYLEAGGDEAKADAIMSLYTRVERGARPFKVYTRGDER